MGGVWCTLVGILNSGSQLMISWDGSCLTLVCSSIVEITTLVLTLMAVRACEDDVQDFWEKKMGYLTPQINLTVQSQGIWWARIEIGNGERRGAKLPNIIYNIQSGFNLTLDKS